jgi:hypothetical protein
LYWADARALRDGPGADTVHLCQYLIEAKKAKSVLILAGGMAAVSRLQPLLIASKFTERYVDYGSGSAASGTVQSGRSQDSGTVYNDWMVCYR